jgi:hypothetical protein
MQPKKSTDPAASAKPSTAQPSVVKLTPEQELKAKLAAEKFDKDLQALFKGGADLSGKETP